MTAANRFVRDFKASAPKTALLAVLTAVGMYFWIPPVWDALFGEEGDSTAAAATTLPAPAAEIAGSEPASGQPPPVEPAGPNWEEVERLRAADDLFRPARRDEVRSHAFTFNDSVLPIDAELVFVPPMSEAAIAAAKAAAAASPALTLGSTLVGPDRRAALINGRIYTEGATFAASGRTWTLRSVEPRRVVLDAAGQTVELRINPFAKQ